MADRSSHSDSNASSKSRPPPHQLATWLVLGSALVGALGLFSLRFDLAPKTSRAYASRVLPPQPPSVLLPSEPLDEDTFPCSDCHEDEEVDRTVRELEEEHDELAFEHGDLWCLHCHDAEDRDRLHLADETRVAFEDSWRLCTQCHAKKRADWRAGVHGKRTGSWWGPKQYRTCVTCHDPHDPPFKPLAPEPPPRRPEAIALGSAAAQEVSHEQAAE